MIQPSLTVVLPAANWPRQTPLDVTVKVENLTGVDMDLTLLSGMTADLLLAKSGQPVWRFSQERMFTQALRPWPLASGEARTLTFTIGTEVLTSLAPGGYSLQAQLNTFDRPSSAPVALTLE
ncbi:BsuPI-related putative proteinase inhibitor [Ferrimonas sediminicola]|nr:BsuPI-related putative proteinase inhibitor [Ferrimonas sediminicola]